MVLTKTNRYMHLDKVLVLLIMFFIASIFTNKEPVLEGLVKIITEPSFLIVDYLEIAGLSATLLNVIIGLLFNLFLIKKLDIKVSGGVFAGMMSVVGFSFFGKNIINTLPIYLGLYLYALNQGTSFKKFFVIALFSSGLSPIVSIGFGQSFLNAFVGISFGILYGFVIPAIAPNVITFHKGYTLSNVGFSGGVFAIIAYGFLELLGYHYDVSTKSSTEYSQFLYIMLISFSCLYLIISLKAENKFKNYRKLISMSGRAVSDFTTIFNQPITALNIGLLGLVTTIILAVCQVTINGPIIGGAITIMGFAAFGKHVRNAIPIIITVFIVGYLDTGSLGSEVIIIALFSTALAPIVGDFGLIVGIVAGVLQYGLAKDITVWQGGLNLYSNGFASGFIAAVISSIFNSININFNGLFKRRNNES